MAEPWWTVLRRGLVALARDRLWWAVVALLALVWGLPGAEGVFSYLFPALERPMYRQEPFTELLWQHGKLVVVSSLFAMGVGSAAGIWVTRPHGQKFKPTVDALATMGQTFPPVAVLAVAVPLVGFGEWPALIALALYGLFPVLQGAVAGLQAVPEPMRQVAHGMGMSAWQCLWRLEVPLALPIWLAGVRSSVIINIGTAAIASTVGAKTLGSPIIVGLGGFNTAYILQGALLVGGLAIVTDMAFERLSHRLAWHA